MAKAELFGALLFLGGCDMLGLGGGKEATDYENVDLNGDMRIEPREFDTWSRDEAVFEMLGGGDSGVVDPLDLSDGMYMLWNQQGPGLTEAEWKRGLNAWFPQADYGSFKDWDLDNDGSISEDELRAGFAYSNLADAWDADKNGEINQDEVYQGIYSIFDQDRNNTLSKAEWNTGIDSWGWDF